MHDDLRAIQLSEDLIAKPPIELWPQAVARVPIPEDMEQQLIVPLAESLRNMGNTYGHKKSCLAETEEHLAEAPALYEAIGMPEAEEVRKDLARVRGQLGQ